MIVQMSHPTITNECINEQDVNQFIQNTFTLETIVLLSRLYHFRPTSVWTKYWLSAHTFARSLLRFISLTSLLSFLNFPIYFVVVDFSPPLIASSPLKTALQGVITFLCRPRLFNVVKNCSHSSALFTVEFRFCLIGCCCPLFYFQTLH